MKTLFSGIYRVNNLNKINKENLDNIIWINKTKKRILANRNKRFYLINSPATLILNTLINKNKKINILDFGAGSLYLYYDIIKNHISLKVFKNNIINYNIVEVPKLFMMYQTLKLKNKNIKISFQTEINFKKKYDIINISDSLHYVNEPKKFINNLIKTNSKYIILNNTRLGNNPTYATIQNFYDLKIPTWFFNEKQILKLFEKKYSTVYNIDYMNKFYEKYSKYPMGNFKKKFRIEHPKTVIFKNKNVF